MIGAIGPAELIIIIIPTAFWIWMLVDCLKRNDDEFPTGGNNAKLIWALVIVLTHFIGALIYLIMIKLGTKKNPTL